MIQEVVTGFRQRDGAPAAVRRHKTHQLFPAGYLNGHLVNDADSQSHGTIAT
jgi:hypothetical protein